MNNPSNLQEQSRAHVMAAGRLLLQRELGGRWQQPDIQEAFADAKQRYGHVLCLCRPEPLKLQIRHRDGLFHLAVWPQEGPKHDTECIYFRDELVDAHRGIATTSQIQATSACPEDRIAYRHRATGTSASAGTGCRGSNFPSCTAGEHLGNAAN